MSRNPPQTLSVKRKRNEAPVDSLVVERTEKRLKSEIFTSKGKPAAPVAHEPASGIVKDGNFIYRRVEISTVEVTASITSPVAQTQRRFIVDRTTGQRILVEHRPLEDTHASNDEQEPAHSAEEVKTATPVPTQAQQAAPPRKRPGRGSALHPTTAKAPKPKVEAPPEDIVRQFEKFSDLVEKQESGSLEPVQSPRTKFKPKAPKLRYKDRHPAAEKGKDPDAMDVDEYVYDTYVREVVVPDADGKIPEPQGTVGVIVINEEDEEWWNGDDESDREFDTDDEDENAEDYYANDYPEDELSSDDEYDRDPYKKYRGESDEEYDLDEEESDEDKDEPFRQTVPVAAPIAVARPGPGYWGRQGE